MTNKEKIMKEMQQLVKQKGSIAKHLSNKDTISFTEEYQKWYTRALRVFETLAPDRLREFIAYYEIDPKRKSLRLSTFSIQDFIKGVAPMDLVDINVHDAVMLHLYNQVTILESIETRLDETLTNIEGTLFAELQDHELKAANGLLKVNLRAAGSLAGVVLESHLQKLALNHKVKITKKNPTIADLNDPLKKKGVYDMATWRKIQYLADLRNLCSHKKDTDPTKDQATELISGVNSIIKNFL